MWTLFQEKPTREGYDALKAYALKAATAFDYNFSASLTGIDQDITRFGKNPELDRWVTSNEGQQALVALVQDLQSRISQHHGSAMPAHDLRQILYKDSAEGLRFSVYEQPEGYKSSFIVPMFSHDIGRLLEGHFYQLGINHDEWIPHAQLSFLMMRETLEDHPEIPQALKDQYMYAVLAHSGANAKTYIGRAVQTCDRMQLIGPEGYFRTMSYVAGLAGGSIAYPRTQEYQLNPPALHSHRSAIAVLEHYARNGYANIGEDHYEWQKHMQMLNTGLLLRMTEACPDLAKYMLSPELGNVPVSSLGEHKNRLDTTAASQHLEDYPLDTYHVLSRQDLHERMISLLESPVGAAQLPDLIKANLRSAVMSLRDDEMGYVQHSMALAQAWQTELDLKDDRLIENILASNHSPVLSAVAAQAKGFGRAPSPQKQAVPAGLQRNPD